MSKGKVANPEPPSFWAVAGICLGLAVITFAVFGQTAGFGFVNYDDNKFVYDNARVAAGLTWNGAGWVFTHAECDLYHPLTMISLMADASIHGLHAGGFHLTNVVLHTISVILLFLVLREMTGAIWRSAFVAAVFAVHPLRAESVAWVAERKDVLSGVFFMLTVWAHARYARGPSAGRYVLVAVLFSLGLLCKPMLVTLPMVLLALDYWPLRRKEPLKQLALEKVPLLALSAGACAATIWAQQTVIQSGGSFSVAHRLANAVTSCAVYLRQMIWPDGLAVFYPFQHDGLPVGEIALAGILVAGLCAVVFVRRTKEPWLLVGWCWYLVMLLPVLGIIQVGDQAHADRYTYLPQIGIYVAVTWMVAEWAMNRVVIGLVMAGVVAVLMICARKQTAYWKNSATLWNHALACTKDNDTAENNLGTDLLSAGDVEGAILHFREALRIAPDDADSHYCLATALAKEGSIDEAVAEFEAALKIEPGDADAHFNLAAALLAEGKVDDAIGHYQSAIQFKPDNAMAHYNLAVALRQEGKTEEAIAHYEAALKWKPGYADAENNLGNLLLQKGSIDEAIHHLQRAVTISPGSARARVNLGNALLQKGSAREAFAQFQEALRIEPDDSSLQSNLAWLLATCSDGSIRDGKEAVELARRANALAGGENAVALRTLAAALAEDGQYGEAAQTAEHALDLAAAQSNGGLAAALRAEIALYQSGQPFHSP